MGGQASFGAISESEFSNVLEILSSTSKGRSFLDEYRRRFQPEDTASLIDSMHRIEDSMDSVRDQLQPERLAEELLHIAMSLDFAIEGAEADPDGDETARRFALADRARSELRTLAANLSGGPDEIALIHPTGNAVAEEAGGYKLRDPADR
jgi:hypothetical protein